MWLTFVSFPTWLSTDTAAGFAYGARRYRTLRTGEVVLDSHEARESVLVTADRSAEQQLGVLILVPIRFAFICIHVRVGVLFVQ